MTLLYGDEFLLGVRVLGKSIRDTGSVTKDMVVLVSDGVSDYAKKLLEVSIVYSVMSWFEIWCFFFPSCEVEILLLVFDLRYYALKLPIIVAS